MAERIFDNGYSLENASATGSSFTLLGGLYGMLVAGSFPGSVTLQSLAADGSTYVTALTAFTAAGYATAYLAAGTYQIAIATATAVYATVSPIPLPRMV